MTDKPNVLKIDGLTFFSNTVAAIVDETGNLITVQALMADYGQLITSYRETIEKAQTHNQELADAMRVLIDEVLDDVNTRDVTVQPLARAIELAERTLAGEPVHKGEILPKEE